VPLKTNAVPVGALDPAEKQTKAEKALSSRRIADAILRPLKGGKPMALPG
jgi:hypothetical protein